MFFSSVLSLGIAQDCIGNYYYFLRLYKFLAIEWTYFDWKVITLRGMSYYEVFQRRTCPSSIYK